MANEDQVTSDTDHTEESVELGGDIRKVARSDSGLAPPEPVVRQDTGERHNFRRQRIPHIALDARVWLEDDGDITSAGKAVGCVPATEIGLPTVGARRAGNR